MKENTFLNTIAIFLLEYLWNIFPTTNQNILVNVQFTNTPNSFPSKSITIKIVAFLNHTTADGHQQ